MNFPLKVRWVLTILGAFIALFGLFTVFLTTMQWVDYPSTTMLNGGEIFLSRGIGLVLIGVFTAIFAWNKYSPPK